MAEMHMEWPGRCSCYQLSMVAIMKLIFINRYFYPDVSATSQMLSGIAFGLAERGKKVTVITSRQLYEDAASRLPTKETLQGVEIRRAWTTRLGRHNLAGRACDYLTFYISASWLLWRISRKGDVVIAKTDPPMLSVAAGPIVRLRGCVLVNWLQDLFPEVAEASGIARGLVFRSICGMLRALRNRSLKLAAMNVALGERMAAYLRRLGVSESRICTIPNWADGALVGPIDPSCNELRRTWGLRDKFVVGYSGNLGRAHEYKSLLRAIEYIEQLPDVEQPTSIAWFFVGGGALYEALERDVRDRGLRSVRFAPYQPRERLAESLSSADVHLVSLRPGLEGLIVPSKFYGIAAAGRPTVFIGDDDGEIARLIRRHDCGVQVATDDGVRLAETILELCADRAYCQRMGANARRAFDAHFDRSIAVKQWLHLIDMLVDAPQLQVKSDPESRSAQRRDQ